MPQPSPSFWVTLATGLILLLALVGSLVLPNRRVWPPTTKGAGWRIALVWMCTILLFAGLMVVGVSSVDTLGLGGGWVRWVGAVLVLGGIGLAFHGVAFLGERATAGLKDALVTTGPYRFTRNPQYLGNLMVIVGLVVLTDSVPAALAAIPGILGFVVFPFTEEPWLERQYGAEYRVYRERVPRFLGPVGRPPAT
ncbi:methyltransferase family protein [Thiohalorhabdus methylotrophus]|uniref:Methyltransferase n=1 Tax=Thiohalorhabdus methylotrophus TaxID=3242694 RepID=A0ABV4TPY0_9GAMM